MKTELRFLLAISLMLLVLFGTNLLFPPVPPEEGPPGATGAADSLSAPVEAGPGEAAPSIPEAVRRAPAEAVAPAAAEAEPERRVVVDGPLYRFEFSTHGARLTSAELKEFRALNRDGPVNLIPRWADGYLGSQFLVGSDTVDLRRVPFRAEPYDGVVLTEGGGPRTLRFVYEHPTAPVRVALTYEFEPERYQVHVRGEVSGLNRPVLLTDLGAGLEFNEADSVAEARAMAYVYNHLNDGIRSVPLSRAEPAVVEGPLLWAAYRSKYFVLALMGGESDELADETSYLSGLLVGPHPEPERVEVRAAQPVGTDGMVAYRLFLGPQEYARLSSLGQGMEEVNPYGWKFFRPIIRPFVSVIMWILVFLHTNLNLSYGWVLIIFGVAMRIVLFPLNHKAMKAQLRNMAVQPLLQEIQAKYKDQPEKLQKEMMKLYKEHGFNPLAGCLPMLLPWPVLIALFFVFQNTIELRGVPFLWLPDLSAKDPYYVLPIFLGLSMFLMQWVSMRVVENPNPQMKMMMWLLPGMMVFIFLNLASGLNLYYATANIATLPQQIWIANERKKMQSKVPKRSEPAPEPPEKQEERTRRRRSRKKGG